MKKILNALREPAPMNYTKGPLVRDPHGRGATRKEKKQSGWVTPRWPKNPGVGYKEAIQEALEPQPFYDDWKDWRDGMRNYYKDASHFKKGIPDRYFGNSFVKEWHTPRHINKKLRKELAIRRAIKIKRSNTT